MEVEGEVFPNRWTADRYRSMQKPRNQISFTSTYNSLLFCRTVVETFISASEEI
jgi:hypothetical protein